MATLLSPARIVNQTSPDALREIATVICANDAEIAALMPPERLAALLPETLGALRVVARSRLQSPTPPAMVVFPDGHEETL